MKENTLSPIIHIGFHKTATTWFQRVYYPSVKNMKYIHHDDVRSVLLDPKGLDEVKPIPAMMDSTDIILCHEELSGNIHNSGMNLFSTKEYAKRIKCLFPESRIVLFIRNQPSMIASAYRQYVKEGGTYSIDRYLFHKEFQRTHREALFSFQHFDYNLKLNFYESLFGKENVHVYLFEDFCEDGKGFIKKYNEDLKLTSEMLPSKSVNDAYTPLIHNSVRIMNLFTRRSVLYKYYIMHIPYVYEMARRGLPHLNKFTSFSGKLTTEKLLGDEIMSYIHQYYLESNMSLSHRYDLNLKRFGYI